MYSRCLHWKLRSRKPEVLCSITWGGAQAIVVDWENGVMHDGTNPRKDGRAAGYCAIRAICAVPLKGMQWIRIAGSVFIQAGENTSHRRQQLFRRADAGLFESGAAGFPATGVQPVATFD